MLDGAWNQVLLEDVAEEITVGHVGSMASEYIPAGIPFLRSQNIEPFGITFNDLKYISHDFHFRLRKSVLSPGDVVIVRTGKPGACGHSQVVDGSELL
jgi:type I restriction enzyme S subunit